MNITINTNKSDRRITNQLLDSIEKHVTFMHVDRKHFIDVLSPEKIQASQRFSVLPNLAQTISDGSREYSLSLRRLINNSEVRYNGTSEFLRNTYNTFSLKFQSYSSTALAEDLMSDSYLVALMQGSSSPFSLLGKFTSIDSGLGTTSKSRPVLIIPGYETFKETYDWEKMHARTEKEIKILDLICI